MIGPEHVVLQVLTENSYASILVTDATSDGKVNYANKAFKRLTGYDPHQVIGKTRESCTVRRPTGR